MAACEACMVDYNARFDKRHKLTHRTTIADVNGPLQLTVPLTHDSLGQMRWSDMRLSTHGDWWNVHRVALESAYGRTPFFEFYIDRFLPVFGHDVVERFGTLEAVDRFIDSRVRELLDLPGDVAEVPAGHSIIDLHATEPTVGSQPPYYQIRADRLGFIAGLSILDLLFNLGPEAQIYLYRLINNTTLWNR